MVLLSDVGGVSGVTQTLKSVAVPPDVINTIVEILQENSDYLEGGRGHFNKPGDEVFGGTYAAHSLGTHTGKAHQHLSNSVLEAVSSLQATGTAMQQFDKEMSAADADSEAAARALLIRTQAAVDGLDDDRNTPPVKPVDAPGSDH